MAWTPQVLCHHVCCAALHHSSGNMHVGLCVGLGRDPLRPKGGTHSLLQQHLAMHWHMHTPIVQLLMYPHCDCQPATLSETPAANLRALTAQHTAAKSCCQKREAVEASWAPCKSMLNTGPADAACIVCRVEPTGKLHYSQCVRKLEVQSWMKRTNPNRPACWTTQHTQRDTLERINRGCQQ